MEIRSNGGRDFKLLAERLRKGGTRGKGIRRELTQELQGLLKPIVADVQDSVRGITVRGRHGGGARARERFDTAAEMRRQAKAAARGRTTRARRSAMPTGLRARIARGVKSRVTYSGFRYGAQIAARTSHLPQSQRRLPRHLNNPRGWRHPTFGNRDNWVTQVGEPWFDRSINPKTPGLRRDIQRIVNRYLQRRVK